MILAQTVLEIYSSGAFRCGIFDRFWNFDNRLQELVNYVIPGMVVQDVGLDDNRRAAFFLKLGYDLGNIALKIMST